MRAVNDVSFEVNEGEILGLIGPNGSGKSTIFNCIAGLYPPNAGTIAFEGAEITGLPPNRICHKGIGRTFQIPRPFRNLTLLENVALSAFFGQRPRRVAQRLLGSSPRRRSRWSGCRPIRASPPTGSAPRR